MANEQNQHENNSKYDVPFWNDENANGPEIISSSEVQPQPDFNLNIDEKFIGISPQNENFFPDPINLSDFNFSNAQQHEDELSLADHINQMHQSPELSEPKDFNDSFNLVNDAIINEIGVNSHPITQYLMAKYDKFSTINGNDVDYGVTFPKNIQSKIFTDFNQSVAASPEKTVFCKPNGYFYTETDIADPQKILTNYGFSSERAKELADKVDFAFIGNTAAKGNKKGAFKSYVMTLKDIGSDNAVALSREIFDQKKSFVIDQIQGERAIDSVLIQIKDASKSIIDSDPDIADKGQLTDVNGNLFLNRDAVTRRLNENSDLVGQFDVIKIDSDDNNFKYRGYSEGLNSYFDSNLSVHKIVPSKDSSLTQNELNNLVREELKSENTHIYIGPEINDVVSANSAIKNNKPNASKENGVKNNNPNAPQQEGGDSPSKGKPPLGRLDEQEFLEKKKKQQNKPEPQSLMDIVAKAAKKLSAAALNALLMLARLLVAMLLTILKAGLALANAGATKAFGVKSVFHKPILSDEFSKAKFTKDLFKVNDGNQPSNSKDVEKENAKDIQEALDAALPALDPKAEFNHGNKIDDKLAMVGVPKFIDRKQDQDLLNRLTDDERVSLEKETKNIFENLTPDKKKDLFESLSIPMHHKIGEDVNPAITSVLMFDSTHGLLLGKGDEIELDDKTKAAVLSAYDIGGKLFYAVASENSDQNYKLNYVEADKLTLLGHNKVLFDNEENLIKQADSLIYGENQEFDGQIEKVEILDYNKPQENSITIEQLAEKLPLVSDFDAFKPINIVEAYNQSNPKPDDSANLYQLHGDRTDTLAANASHGQTHPLYGRLLNLNDEVSCTLPNSGLAITGAISGAFSHNNNLYYSVKNGENTYNMPAKELVLTGVDSGRNVGPVEIQDLMRNQVKNAVVGREFQGAQVIPLTHQDSSSFLDKNFGIKKGFVVENVNDAFKTPTSKPLLRNNRDEYTGGFSAYSYKNGSDQYTLFTLGEVDSDDKKSKSALAVVVPTNALSQNKKLLNDVGKLSLMEVSLDSPYLKKEDMANYGLVESKLTKFRDMYNEGVNQTKAALIHDFYKKMEQSLPTDSVAKQYHVAKVLAKKILVETVRGVSAIATPTTVLGLAANLAGTVADPSSVLSVLNNPASQSILKTVVNTIAEIPKTIFDVNNDSPLFPLKGQTPALDVQNLGSAYNAEINQSQPFDVPKAQINNSADQEVPVTPESILNELQQEPSPTDMSAQPKPIIQRISVDDSIHADLATKGVNSIADYLNGEQSAQERASDQLVLDRVRLEGTRLELIHGSETIMNGLKDFIEFKNIDGLNHVEFKQGKTFSDLQEHLSQTNLGEKIDDFVKRSSTFKLESIKHLNDLNTRIKDSIDNPMDHLSGSLESNLNAFDCAIVALSDHVKENLHIKDANVIPIIMSKYLKDSYDGDISSKIDKLNSSVNDPSGYNGRVKTFLNDVSNITKVSPSQENEFNSEKENSYSLKPSF